LNRRGLRLRDGLLVALVVGLALSISLSEATLAALAVWLVWTRRVPPMSRAQWPLLAPLLAFSGWSIVVAAVSAAPAESLAATKTLLPRMSALSRTRQIRSWKCRSSWRRWYAS